MNQKAANAGLRFRNVTTTMRPELAQGLLPLFPGCSNPNRVRENNFRMPRDPGAIRFRIE
jgi:hypothetical protein